MKKFFFIPIFVSIFLIIGCASQSPVGRSTTHEQPSPISQTKIESTLDLQTIFVITPRAITPPSFLEQLRARVSYTIFDQTDLYVHQATGYYLILNYYSLSEQQQKGLPIPDRDKKTQTISTENNHIIFLNVDGLNSLTSSDYDTIILALENLVTSNTLSNAPRRNPAQLNPSQTWEQYFAQIFPQRERLVPQIGSTLSQPEPTQSQTEAPPRTSSQPSTPGQSLVEDTRNIPPLSETPITITNPSTTVNALEFTLEWTGVELATFYGIQQADSLEKLLSYPEWEETFSTREVGTNQTEIAVYYPGTYYFRVRAKQHMNRGVVGRIIWENGPWSEVFAITLTGEPNPTRIDTSLINRESKPKRPLASAQEISFELVHDQSGKSVVINSQTTLDEIRADFANEVRYFYVQPHADGQMYIFVLGENDLLTLFSFHRFYDFQAVWFSEGISYKGVTIGSTIEETIQALGQPSRTGTDHNWLVYDFNDHHLRTNIFPETRTIQRLTLSFYQP